jgi:peptidyl-prolyl cis-trans isomerase C
MLVRLLSCCLLLCVTIPLTGCGSGNRTDSGEGKEAVIARVNERAITAGEFQARLEEQPPFVRSRYATLEKKKEFLDNLIRFELLVQEARRQGLDKDPELQATLEKLMVQKLVRKQSEAGAGELSEAELRKYYDAHLSEFVRPERVRISHLFLASPKGDANRAQVRAQATRLLSEVKRQETGTARSAFELLASSQSQDAGSKAAGGDLGFHTREELEAAWGPELAEAALALKQVSDIGGVVETDKGFHLVKLLGRQLGVDQSFDTVKERIQAQLAMENRSRNLDTFISNLKDSAKVEVKEAALEKVPVEGAVGGGLTAPTP